MSAPPPTHVDLERGVVTLGGRRLVMHCHHYNVFLQRTIEEGLKDRAPRLLTAAGMEAGRLLLSGLESDLAPGAPAGSPGDVILRAAELLRAHGFGRLDVAGLGERGGAARMERSHYAIGWTSRWGTRATPCCFFVAGFLAGAVAVAGRLAPERVAGRELACLAAGAERCSFAVEVW